MYNLFGVLEVVRTPDLSLRRKAEKSQMFVFIVSLFVGKYRVFRKSC